MSLNSEEKLKDTFPSDNSFSDEQKAELAASLGHGISSEDGAFVSSDLDYMIDIISNMSEPEAKTILQDAIEFHKEDPNFHLKTLDTIKQLLNPNTQMYDEETRLYKMKMEAALIHYHSPYPEVRSISDPMDNPEMPVETFRCYFIGVIWVILGVGINQFFSPRQPPVYISNSLLQLLVYPCGKLFETFPDWGFNVRGMRYSLNPGPWSYKEQILITIMFNISGLAYINDQVFVQRLSMFYHNEWAGFGYQFTLLLSTQFLGFGLAGFVRHILIYPANCLWPAVFPTLALNRALLKPERTEVINGWTLTRYKAFSISFIVMFVYFWLPGYLFQALSMFNWITWISPNNYNLATITGSITGLGINPIPSFDWNIIDMASPLFTPFFSYFNMYIGGLIGFVAVIPAIYYTNMYNTGYLPINSNRIFTNTGEGYDVKKILNEKGIAEESLYQSYSPPYYTAGNLVTYGAFFAMYPAVIVDTLLRHWNVLYDGFKTMFLAIGGKVSLTHKYVDAHSRMMREYREVPTWWYFTVSVIALALGIVCVEHYPTETPVWGIFFALAIGFIFLVPIGILYATTNTLFSLNVFTELVAGYALPGKGIALMIIKAFGLNTNLQAISFVSDQKLAHYAKIPPRATFRAQIIAAFISSIVSLGVANWQINNYEGICTPLQEQKFTCPGVTTYYAASVVWGVIGPKRVFNSLYPILPYCFLIGALIPIPFWLGERFISARIFRQMYPVVIMSGMINFGAPYNLSYMTGGLYVSIAMMWYVRNRYIAWFEKYVYVLSAGLSAGIALSLIIIFFSVQYHPKPLNWWGNTVSTDGLDAKGLPRLQLPEKGYFGVSPGEYNW